MPFVALLALAIGGAAPAAAVAVIGEQRVRFEALPPAEAEAVKAPSGLSGAETAVMLIGSLVFSLVLLGRKLD